MRVTVKTLMMMMMMMMLMMQNEAVCECSHNTDGDHCGQCLPTFNDVPWAMAVGDNASVCQGLSASWHL